MKRIAIIPARGGSKRIHKKNIKSFCGKPIISYILNTAKESNIFTRIHVSTDSKEIAKTVSSLGFAPEFLRPNYLSDDNTPIMPVLKYVCNEYMNRGEKYDQVWLLMPTSPFIDVNDIIKAEKKFSKSNSDKSLLGVSEYPAPIEWAFNIDKSGTLIPLYSGMFATRSQDIKESYYDSGAFCIFPYRTVINSVEAGNDSEFIGYTLPKYKSMDIDFIDDWEMAEAVYYVINYKNKLNKAL